MAAAIWFQPPGLEAIRRMGANTLMEHLGIEVTEVGADFLAGRMPVDRRTRQPAGLLHGGASVALAETLASLGANLVVDPKRNYCVGLEINANHVRSVTSGVVTGRSSPLHLGRSTQIWETKIHQDEKLVCVSRITLAVIGAKKT